MTRAETCGREAYGGRWEVRTSLSRSGSHPPVEPQGAPIPIPTVAMLGLAVTRASSRVSTVPSSIANQRRRSIRQFIPQAVLQDQRHVATNVAKGAGAQASNPRSTVRIAVDRTELRWTLEPLLSCPFVLDRRSCQCARGHSVGVDRHLSICFASIRSWVRGSVVAIAPLLLSSQRSGSHWRMSGGDLNALLAPLDLPALAAMVGGSGAAYAVHRAGRRQGGVAA